MDRPKIDTTSATWLRIQEHCNRRLSRLSDDLETPGTSIERTEAMRGAIREIRDLLALPDRNGKE